MRGIWILRSYTRILTAPTEQEVDLSPCSAQVYEKNKNNHMPETVHRPFGRAVK